MPSNFLLASSPLSTSEIDMSITPWYSNTHMKSITLATVTQKGQITIPKNMRDKLNIQPYDRVALTLKGNQIAIKAQPDILDLAGKFIPKHNANQTPLQARVAMEKQYQRT